MRRPRLALALVALLVASTASLSTASPPRPGTEDNGLDENESATLWSRDDDSGYLSNAAYRDAYGENRTAVHQIANGTDLTFKRPPATAAIWSRHDFLDYRPGDRSTSVYPPHANRTNGTVIADAHATIFGIHPSTKAHRTPNDTRWYVAPEGRLRGAVDYRVRTHPDRRIDNGSIAWTVLRHEITEVRLLQDGEVVARANGTHWPQLAYDIEGRQTTLTLEADVAVRIAETVTITRPDPPNRTTNGSIPATGNGSTQPPRQVTREVSIVTDSVTVSDSVDVEVYDPTAVVHHARYPDGDEGVAIFQNRPWQGYTLTEDESSRVRGIWRFYTAREPEWDVLHHSTADGTTTTDSDALPVHAYPSRLGPRAEPVGIGPEIIRVWGVQQAPPNGSLGEHVLVEVVTEPYTTSYGVAVRTATVDRDALTVHGIVRGETATLAEPASGTEREIRTSDLTAEIVNRNESGVTVLLELRDAETGEPIVLDDPDEPRLALVVGDGRNGSITIDQRRVETNASGQATVFVDDAGVYTARYEPGTWLTHDPAYVGDTATVRWHPLTTIEGWAGLVFQALVWFLPFAVALYAGRTLGGMFRYGGDP